MGHLVLPAVELTIIHEDLPEDCRLLAAIKTMNFPWEVY